MPSVAVRSRPNGLPIAIATSPTLTPHESANCSGLTPAGTRRRVDVHDGEVAGLVDALDLAADRAALGAELDLHGLAGAHDVVVGDQRALAVDEEAGAAAAAGLDRDDGGAVLLVDRARAGLAPGRRDRLGGDGRQRGGARDAPGVVLVQQRAGGESAAADRQDGDGRQRGDAAAAEPGPLTASRRSCVVWTAVGAS